MITRIFLHSKNFHLNLFLKFTIDTLNDALEYTFRKKQMKLLKTARNARTAGKLVSKLTLGPFLTLSVRNDPNLQNYLFQTYTSLNPSRVEQNYTIQLLKMAKTIY